MKGQWKGEVKNRLAPFVEVAAHNAKKRRFNVENGRLDRKGKRLAASVTSNVRERRHQHSKTKLTTHVMQLPKKSPHI